MVTILYNFIGNNENTNKNMLSRAKISIRFVTFGKVSTIPSRKRMLRYKNCDLLIKQIWTP